MTNILEAICNIVEQDNFNIKTFYTGRNRANSMGEALEAYIKDSFANTFSESDERRRLEIHNEKFSWLGSQNNPPDIMIRGGDAIEVKKTQSPFSNLALNSSYPKADLQSNSPMTTSECRDCETWETKPLIYCVGHTTDTSLKSLWLLYGDSYAAKQETYERIKTTISAGIKEITDVVFSETKELGRVNKVDPLGITALRIRGMWHIDNPRKVFKYLHTTDTAKTFELVSIVPVEKWNAFDEASRERISQINKPYFSIVAAKIKDPNNPAKLIEVKLIKYLVS